MPLLYDGNNGQVTQFSSAGEVSGAALSFAFRTKVTVGAANDEIWAQFTSAVGGMACRWGGTAQEFRIIIGSAANVFYNLLGGVVNDEWQHWVVVYDGTAVGDALRLRVWLNGVLQTATSFTNTVPATVPSAGAGTPLFTTGTVTAGRAPSGALCDLMFWKSVLPDSAAASQWMSWRPLHYDQLKLWCPYDDKTTAADYSGNARHATALTTGVSENPEGSPVGLGHQVILIG